MPGFVRSRLSRGLTPARVGSMAPLLSNRTLCLARLLGAVLLALGGCASLTRLPAEPPAAEVAAQPEITGCLPTQVADNGASGTSQALPLEPCRFLVERDTSGFAVEAASMVRREHAWWES